MILCTFILLFDHGLNNKKYDYRNRNYRNIYPQVIATQNEILITIIIFLHYNLPSKIALSWSDNQKIIFQLPVHFAIEI